MSELCKRKRDGSISNLSVYRTKIMAGDRGEYWRFELETRAPTKLLSFQRASGN